MARAKVICSFTGGTYGSREKGEVITNFDKDPDGLVKLGLVEIEEEQPQPKAK